MADVHLRYAKHTDPPAVCMRCGKAATILIEGQVFSTSPWWTFLFVCLGFIPYFVLEFVFRLIYRFRFDVPVCASHRNHFMSRTIGFYGSWILIIAICLGAYYSGIRDRAEREQLFITISVPCSILSCLLVICWSCLTGIKAYDTTSMGMMVCGVSEEFANAYERSIYIDDSEISPTDAPPKVPSKESSTSIQPPD